MSDKTKNTCTGRRGGCRSSRALRFGLFAVLLVGTGVLGATLIGQTWAGSGWKHHGRVHSVEEARDKARDVAAWVAGAVDASETQRTEVDGILSGFAETLYPMVEKHRENRRALITELTRPNLQRDTVEALRRAELALADEASSAMVDAFFRVSEVLEPEQRQSLTALAARFKHHGGHKRGMQD